MLCEPNSLYVEKNKEGWIVLRILSWKYEGLRQERKVLEPSSLGAPRSEGEVNPSSISLDTRDSRVNYGSLSIESP